MSQFKNDYLVVINKKTYCFDFEKIKALCFCSGEKKTVDTKVTDVMSFDAQEDNSLLTQKVVEENSYNNTQNDVLMQDIVKTFIIRLLEAPEGVDDEMDFSTALAFNTCLNSGIIKEIK